MSKELRIIFLGTPEFASTSLKQIVEANFNVVAVVTAPDKPQGRGKKLGKSAVKQYAETVQIPILQPTNLKSEDFQQELKSFDADIQVVVAFRMLPEKVWSMPTLGTFNLHASLLPQYRGAAPINWAIINGEKETGITTFFLKHEIDTGAIIFQEKEAITEDDNVGTLYERLMHKGGELVVKTLEAVAQGDYPQLDQQEIEQLEPAPKIFKEDCEIDWNLPAKKVKDFIRGLSPYPGAFTTLDDKTFKIFDSEIIKNSSVDSSGVFSSPDRKSLLVSCRDFHLSLKEVQLQGKKRMKIADFLAGYQLNNPNKK